MGDLSMFIPITKVDATQRLVYGIATAEVQDRAGEICDYASTKPHYERWSEEIAQSTGGKSLGNLRAMHGPVAAGKVTAINFNDDARQIEICAKVVDDLEWIKVTEGVYTGFSQGGAYERRWTDDDGLTHYTAVPTEISLVDLPCLPESRFEMIKADGTLELRAFEPGSALADRLDDFLHALALLGELSSDELDKVPDLAPLIEDVHDLAARLASIVRTMPIDGPSSRGKPRATWDISEDSAARAESNANGRMPRNTDFVPRIHSDSRERTRRPRAPVVASSTDRQAEKMLRWDLQKRIDTFQSMLDDVLKRVKNIEQQPLPLPLSGGSRVVAKHADGLETLGASTTIDTLLTDPEALSLLAIRLAQRNGRVSFR